jgi:hypothetical protein
MGKFTITEDEKRHIKGLYLINEATAKCQNERFDIVNGTKTIKKQITREDLIKYVSSSRSDVSVIQYCNSKRTNSFEASVKNGELVLDQYGA